MQSLAISILETTTLTYKHMPAVYTIFVISAMYFSLSPPESLDAVEKEKRDRQGNARARRQRRALETEKHPPGTRVGVVLFTSTSVRGTFSTSCLNRMDIRRFYQVCRWLMLCILDCYQ